MDLRKSRKYFLILHLAALAVILFFPLYRAIAGAMPSFLSQCVLHDRLFLYCPVCGGTRAVDALLHLDVVGALRYNPLVTIGILILLIADFVAWVRFFRHEPPFLRFPQWSWVVMAVVLVGYAVLRNYLMIAHGIDPTGDLVDFWNSVRG
ncbi:MAG: DUF2752 domain-containing protein [Clostridia bacterium]|nr:DUF2752 domain-containing protein [Clostridia bacterium]